MSLTKPLVSVVITTRNNQRTIKKLLESLKGQSYKNIEIIVVDNNSKDYTLKIAKKYTTKIFDKGPERSAQRNLGAKRARGSFYLILDSDMVVGKNVISECVNLCLMDLSIKEVIIPEKSFGEGFWSGAKSWEREINEGEKYFESARFFSKGVFWEFGGFDEEMTGPEDWDLPQRIAKKYKSGRIKSYILHDEGRQTLLSLAKKKYYYGLSAHKYLKSQNLPLIGPTTIYFMRPSFYKKWRKLVFRPVPSLGMFVMLFAELIGGGLGYIRGRMKNE